MNDIVTCPVQCQYCMAQKIDSRSRYWTSGSKIGINKSCVFINRLPSDAPLSQMPIPWELLQNETIGFQGITDCMWDIFHDDVVWILNHLDTIKTIVFCTKMDIPDDIISAMKEHNDKVVVIVSTTGLDRYEKTTTQTRINTIKKCLDADISILPIVHPYIHGVSDISFFTTLNEMGIKYISWKGFRYNEQNMHLDIDEKILQQYVSENEDEILIGEDYIKNQADKYNLQYIEMKKFINTKNKGIPVPYDVAREQVLKLFDMCVLSSSAKKDEVIEYRIKSRTGEIF